MEESLGGTFKLIGSKYSIGKSKMKDMLLCKDLWLLVQFGKSKTNKIDAWTRSHLTSWTAPICIRWSSRGWDIWPSLPCHRFGWIQVVGLIAISGYKLYLYPFPIFRFPRMIVHHDSLRVVLYPASASMLMETWLLFSADTCWTWCRVIVLPFGNWMGTSPTLAIAHSYSFPSRTVPLVSTE